MTEKQKAFFKKKEDEFAKKMIEAIKSGKAGFMKPVNNKMIIPINAITGKEYEGANVFKLLMEGRADPRWITFKKAKENGFNVKKGAKSALISFFKPVSAEELEEWKKNGSKLSEKPFPKVKAYNVFNAEDIENMKPIDLDEISVDENNLEMVKQIIKDFKCPIIFDQKGKTAYYHTKNDEIHMGNEFDSDEEFFSIIIHEMAHATGHKSRLNRDLSGKYGDENYAFEELIAQMSSYMLSAYLSIPHDPTHSLQYVESWLNVLENDYSKIKDAVKSATDVVNFLMTKAMKNRAMQSFQIDEPQKVA